MEYVEFSDLQLQALIDPVASGLQGSATIDSGSVAVAVLAQMVLEYRRNRAQLKENTDYFVSVGKEGLAAFMPVVAPLIDKVKSFFEETLEELGHPVESPDFKAPDAEHVG